MYLHVYLIRHTGMYVLIIHLETQYMCSNLFINKEEKTIHKLFFVISLIHIHTHTPELFIILGHY